MLYVKYFSIKKKKKRSIPKADPKKKQINHKMNLWDVRPPEMICMLMGGVWGVLYVFRGFLPYDVWCNNIDIQFLTHSWNVKNSNTTFSWKFTGYTNLIMYSLNTVFEDYFICYHGYEYIK